MANITRTFWLDLPSSNTGRSDIAYAIEGGSYTTTGVTESSTIPGRYKVSVTYDASLNTAIGWRIPLSGGGYDYAIEGIHPTIVAPAGLDLVIVEPAVGSGTAVNVRQSLSAIAARTTGGWTFDNGTGIATYYACENPIVSRLQFVQSANTVTCTATLPS